MSLRIRCLRSSHDPQDHHDTRCAYTRYLLASVQPQVVSEKLVKSREGDHRLHRSRDDCYPAFITIVNAQSTRQIEGIPFRSTISSEL